MSAISIEHMKMVLAATIHDQLFEEVLLEA
jgi:hypothetical protein